MKDTLAIIIPAYKPDYLEETLESLTKQTNKDFKIYIGDDASPFSLEDIVGQFSDKLNIVYKKFDNNVGGYSLTKQWERCIEMSNEKWIWLFSDDDLLSPSAVDSFYKELKNKPNSQFFKFFTTMIDAEGKKINLFRDKTNLETNIISAKDFISKRLRNDRFRSYVVEYIFRKELYEKYKFINFPLAWCSDDATWLIYAIENSGIDVIQDTVYWRLSGINISSKDVKDDEKKKASIQYVNWLVNFVKQKNINIPKEEMLLWLFNQISPSNKKDVKKLLNKLNYEFSENDLMSVWKKYNNISQSNKIKRIIKNFLKKYLV